MRNKYLLIFALGFTILISSCSKQKSVTEQLDLNEVSSLIEQDSLYEQIIQSVEIVREVFEKDLVLKSKFKDLTYKDFLEYNKELSDTIFQKNLYEKFEAEFNSRMDSLLKKYKEPVDKKIAFYKEQLEKYSPSKFFSISFAGINKEYYSSMREVRQVNVKFKITPLQGPIQGGSFRYKIIPKVTKKSVASAGCRFSHYTKNPSVYMWEAPYDIEDEFESTTTARIKENYDFEYEILTARVGGKTYSFDDIDVPFYFELYLDKDTLTNYEYANLIEEQFYVKSVSYFDLLMEITNSEKQKVNKIAFELEKLIKEND